ncbi:DUF4169 family protein [Szabonella alba]|uniref:DUF4169 family protein n=1 Tax=Szabonella alba TaxID=2804194 RepID=A0A8K0V8R0_9RHOB|nr:DUF4169 family protein [Szabonella alba]MBL4917557.1 DUF4169 family protein [Szabonella alba]
MAEVTSLNRVRKERARAQKRAQADANAVKFGRSKAERLRDQAEAAKVRRDLDGARREEDRAE